MAEATVFGRTRITTNGFISPPFACPAEDWITLRLDIDALQRADPALQIDFGLERSVDGGASWRRTDGCRFRGGVTLLDDDLATAVNEFSAVFARLKSWSPDAKREFLVADDWSGSSLRVSITPNRQIQCGLTLDSGNRAVRIDPTPRPMR